MITVQILGKGVSAANVSIAQPSSNRLINKEQVVVVGPGIVVLEHFDFKVLSEQQQRTNF